MSKGVARSKNTGQNREECTICAVWAPESENRRNVKSNSEVTLPLTFLQHLQKTEKFPGLKKRAMGTLCFSNYHMHIIYQHDEASNE